MSRRLAAAVTVLAGCSVHIAAGAAYRTPSSFGADLTASVGFIVAGTRDATDDAQTRHATFLDVVESIGATQAGAYGTIALGLDELFDPSASSLRLELGPRIGVHVTAGPTSELMLGAHVLLLHEPHGAHSGCDTSFHEATVETCRGVGVDLGAQLLAGHGAGGLVTLAFVFDVTAL
jgi:hypothetical protein